MPSRTDGLAPPVPELVLNFDEERVCSGPGELVYIQQEFQ